MKEKPICSLNLQYITPALKQVQYIAPPHQTIHNFIHFDKNLRLVTRKVMTERQAPPPSFTVDAVFLLWS